MNNTSGVSNGGNVIYCKGVFPPDFRTPKQMGSWARKKLKNCPGAELLVVTAEDGFSLGATGYSRVHVSPDERPLPGWMMVRPRGPERFADDALDIFAKRIGAGVGLSLEQYEESVRAAAGRMASGATAAAAGPSKPWERPLPKEMEGISFGNLGVDDDTIRHQLLLLDGALFPYSAKRWFLESSGINALATILLLRDSYFAETRQVYECVILSHWPEWEELAISAARTFKESGRRIVKAHSPSIVGGWPNVKDRVPTRIVVRRRIGPVRIVDGFLRGIPRGVSVLMEIAGIQYYRFDGRTGVSKWSDISVNRNDIATLTFSRISSAADVAGLLEGMSSHLGFTLSAPELYPDAYSVAGETRLDLDEGTVSRIQGGLKPRSLIRLFDDSVGVWHGITRDSHAEINFFGEQVGNPSWSIIINSRDNPSVALGLMRVVRSQAGPRL